MVTAVACIDGHIRKAGKDTIAKDLLELIEAQKELNRPSVGSTVRNKGKAVAIADERAALVDILAYTPTLAP